MLQHSDARFSLVASRWTRRDWARSGLYVIRTSLLPRNILFQKKVAKLWYRLASTICNIRLITYNSLLDVLVFTVYSLYEIRTESSTNLHKLSKTKIDKVIYYKTRQMSGKPSAVLGGYVKLSWKISATVSSLDKMTPTSTCSEPLTCFWHRIIAS